MSEPAKILFVIFFWWLLHSVGIGQQPIRTDTSLVCYSGHYSGKGKTGKQAFFSRLSDLVFGRADRNLERPVAVVVDTDGTLWISDQGRGYVSRLSPDLKDCHSFGLKGNQPFPSLAGCCVNKHGDVFVSDSKLNKVYVLRKGTRFFEAFNRTGLSQPTGIACLNERNELWVTETRNHRISMLNQQGDLIRQFGERGNEKGFFNFPTNICMDSSGKALVVDAMNFRIQIFDKYGQFVSSFGQAGDCTGYFSRPKGIAVDVDGNILVTDAMFHNVQIFDKSGTFLYYFGTQGREPGEFWMPTGISIDQNGRILVADSYNARIQFFNYCRKND